MTVSCRIKHCSVCFANMTMSISSLRFAHPFQIYHKSSIISHVTLCFFFSAAEGVSSCDARVETSRTLCPRRDPFACSLIKGLPIVADAPVENKRLRWLDTCVLFRIFR